MVRRLPSSPARRAIFALLLLAPFALGSNRCVVGALGFGGPMQCLSVPSSQADAAPHACCHGASQTDGEDEGAPATSCCIEAVPVPVAASLDAPAPGHDVFLAADPADELVTDAAASMTVRAEGESPPPRRTPAPSHTRAPPRA